MSGGLGSLALASALTLAACSREMSGDQDDDAGTTTAASTDTDEDSSGTGDADTDDTVDTSLSFYAGPEFDFPTSGSGCDPWLQDCVEGDKCVPFADGSAGALLNANKCVPVQGDGSVGDPCVFGGVTIATDDCDADSYCWPVGAVEGQLQGTCAPLCSGTLADPQCPVGTSCALGALWAVTVCGTSCLPKLDDCSDGFGCTWLGADFVCAAMQSAPIGDVCIESYECELGALCVPSAMSPGCAGDGCCAAFCDLLAPVCAQPGTSCEPFFEEGLAPPPASEQGICVVPP